MAATTTRTHACTTQHEPASADSSTAPKQKLALDQLSVVRFVTQVSLVQTATTWSRIKWEEGRKLWYLRWLLAAVEIVILNFWILIHTLPWPEWTLEYLHRIDEAVVKALEWTQGKIDWVSSNVKTYVVPPITFVWDKVAPNLEKSSKNED